MDAAERGTARERQMCIALLKPTRAHRSHMQSCKRAHAHSRRACKQGPHSPFVPHTAAVRSNIDTLALVVLETLGPAQDVPSHWLVLPKHQGWHQQLCNVHTSMHMPYTSVCIYLRTQPLLTTYSLPETDGKQSQKQQRVRIFSRLFGTC